ncbi:MAG: protein phosphatase 2C domain-containing protein [Alphaproteobacteria bacterium]|nr:MAG: protein phosphatase 2C domain-containing protein [Alphaproteobacteria bacterium]
MKLHEWRAAAASVIGTSHIKGDLPCQDAHAFDLIAGVEEVLVLVASDGAGSASRSDVGSHLACRELLDNIRLYLGDGKLVSELTHEIALGWLENASAAIQLVAAEQEIGVREYACTLLAALVSPTHTAYLQIGDGAIVVRSDSDGWAYIFWPQHGEYINTTVFLTDPAALQNFQFEVAASVIHEVAAFTDGIESLVLHYATQSVHGPFFDMIFEPVRMLPVGGYSESLSGHLKAYLSSDKICEKTDDDKTLLIASRLKRAPSRALVVIEE